jgi:hypothetical protein
MRVLIFSTTFFWTISHSQNKSVTYYQKCTCLHIKCPLFLTELNQIWYLRGFRKLLKYQISWRPIQWEPKCSKRTDGRADTQTWQSWQSLFEILRAPKTAPKNGIVLIFLTSAPIHVSCGMKAQWNQGGGRILLGANNGGGAVMLRPIRF